MLVSFATRMLIAVADIAAIMAAIAVVLATQGRMTSQVGLWLVIIGLIPVAVNYLWWHRQYANASPLRAVKLRFVKSGSVLGNL
jgi:mannose/fructose/N-acetylgalactosamine-specific phosphotransferase system component IID